MASEIVKNEMETMFKKELLQKVINENETNEGPKLSA
jgi:hypothetical protein